jgi:hypothetical protein
MFGAWGATRTALGSYGGVSSAIAMVAGALYWVACALALLFTFEVSLSAVWVPLSTLVMGLGFALGPPAQRLLDSLLFVLVIAPYDVGDRVAVDRVAGGAALAVEQVHVLTSEFTELGTGRRLIARNADLTGMTVTNLRRSPNAAFSVRFLLEPGAVTPAVLRQLTDALTAHVRARPLEWRPGPSLSVSFADPNRVELAWGLTHHGSWAEGGKVWRSHTDFVVSACAAMRSLRLAYTLPPQPVALVTTGTGAGAVLGVLGGAGGGDGGGGGGRRGSHRHHQQQRRHHRHAQHAPAAAEEDAADAADSRRSHSRGSSSGLESRSSSLDGAAAARPSGLRQRHGHGRGTAHLAVASNRTTPTSSWRRGGGDPGGDDSEGECEARPLLAAAAGLSHVPHHRGHGHGHDHDQGGTHRHRRLPSARSPAGGRGSRAAAAAGSGGGTDATD